jgi:hypothetical protein
MQPKYTTDQLDTLLNGWPEDTSGHIAERTIIIYLYGLGQAIGYGRLAQLAGHMADLQCYDKKTEAIDLKRDRFGLLSWKLPDDFEEVAKL